MVIKLQIFTIKNFLSQGFALKKDENYNPQVFVKECKHINKKLIRHIIDDLKGSSDDFDDSDGSDEEQVKAMRVMFSENVLFEKVIF